MLLPFSSLSLFCSSVICSLVYKKVELYKTYIIWKMEEKSKCATGFFSKEQLTRTHYIGLLEFSIMEVQLSYSVATFVSENKMVRWDDDRVDGSHAASWAAPSQTGEVWQHFLLEYFLVEMDYSRFYLPET